MFYIELCEHETKAVWNKTEKNCELFPSSLSVLQVTVHSPIIQMVPSLKRANNYLFIKGELLGFTKPPQPHPHFELP